MSEGAPAAKMAASGPSSLIALPSPRRGTGRGRALWRTERPWTHGRMRTSPEDVLCCTPPSSFSSPALHLHVSVLNAPLLTTTCALDGGPLPALLRAHARADLVRAWRHAPALDRLCVRVLPPSPPAGDVLDLPHLRTVRSRLAFERRARAGHLSSVRRHSVEKGGRAATRLVSLVCANASAVLMERLEDCIFGDDAICRAPVSLLWRAAARTARLTQRRRRSSPSLPGDTPFCWRSWDLCSSDTVHAPCSLGNFDRRAAWITTICVQGSGLPASSA